MMNNFIISFYKFVLTIAIILSGEVHVTTALSYYVGYLIFSFFINAFSEFWERFGNVLELVSL